MFFCLRMEPLLKFEVSALKLGRSQKDFWFFFHRKIFLIKTSLDKWKAVLTTLPKHFRPVVRKVLDQSPETLNVYEFFHIIFFSKLFLCTRRMNFTQLCRKFFFSKSERIRKISNFAEKVFTPIFCSQGVECSFNKLQQFFL